MYFYYRTKLHTYIRYKMQASLSFSFSFLLGGAYSIFLPMLYFSGFLLMGSVNIFLISIDFACVFL